MTEKEKKIILDIHNKLRSRIAGGGERRGQPGPQPGASNMKIMVSTFYKNNSDRKIEKIFDHHFQRMVEKSQ